jgi:hypothetical protein
VKLKQGNGEGRVGKAIIRAMAEAIAFNTSSQRLWVAINAAPASVNSMQFKKSSIHRAHSKTSLIDGFEDFISLGFVFRINLQALFVHEP